MNPNQKIKFDKRNLAEFYPLVRLRVDEYFKKKAVSRHANGLMVGKTIFILSVFVLTYALIMSNALNGWIVLLLAVIHGFFTAMIGLNVTHDAMHDAYTSNPALNKYIGIFFNIVGGNDYVWKTKHNFIHHTFTNIPEHDDDINQTALLRMSPKQKRRWIHRFQHFYIFFLYSLASLSWVFAKDYVNFLRIRFAWPNDGNHPKSEYFRLFFYKAVYYVLFIILPFTFLKFPWYDVLMGFVLMHLVEGLTMSVIFQLAHVVEGVSFPVPDETGKMENSWAVHQMYTTADFARNNKIVNYFFGGLNFQIEHHLFPQVCHVHYRDISVIVKQTAEEYNLPYIESETFLGAIGSHYRMMKSYGRDN